MQEITAVILAGGIGKRFAPLTINKTLLPMFGKPLLQHCFEFLQSVGFKKIIIASNQANLDWISQYSHPDLQIQTHLQEEPLGMGDALLTLKDVIKDQQILVMNALDLVDRSLFENLAKVIPSSEAVVTGIKMDKYFPGGYLQVEGDRVISVVEKPGEGNEPSKLVNLVFHYFRNPEKFLSILENTHSDQDDQYEKALTTFMQQQIVKYSEYEGYWQTIKHSHMVLNYMDALLSHRLEQYISPSAKVSPLAVIEGKVFIDDDAVVQEQAVIKGPAYIGKRAVVGTHSLVRSSCIEEGTGTGFGSEVARSYIGPGCMLHHNFIGDSILESKVNPSYGTCTANWRFDNKAVEVKLPDGKQPTNREKFGAIIGDQAFLGINCSIMPGVTIGQKAFIYPGTIVHSPVPAHSTVKMIQQQEERK